MKPELKAASDTIEGLIDTSSLSLFLNLVANICDEKAEHIRTNWQDEATAKHWQSASAKILTLAGKITV